MPSKDICHDYLDATQINSLGSARASHLDEFHKFLERRAACTVFSSSERSRHGGGHKCLPNTRVGVRHAIRQWFDGVYDPPICWLRGPAGSGKSAIAQTVAEEYEESGELAASFFFDRGLVDHRDITNFVPAIAFQLSVKIPQTKAWMQKAFEHDPSIPDQSRQYQFTKLIIDPLLELGQALSHKIVVIDGLDQRDGEYWVEELIALITETCRDERLHLRFCLTSRIDVPILTLPEASMKPSRIYSLALEDFDACSDIHIFFEAEFKDIHKRNGGGMQNGPELWPSHLDVDRLVRKSSGLFMFASMIVKFVDDGSNEPHSKLQAVLTSLNDRHDATSDTCTSESFIYYLVRLLASDDIGIQAAAITGLESITLHGGSGVVVSANAIPCVVGLLESTDIYVLIGACKVLVNTTTKLDIARAEALNANAIPLLNRLLSLNNPRVQRSATFALMGITLHESATTAALILDLIPNTVRLLGSDDANIQASAAAVLQNITICNGSEVAVKAEAIPPLIKLLTSSNVVVLIAVCAALENITSTSDRARTEALNENVIPKLVGLLSLDDIRVQRLATFILMNVTLHRSLETATLALGAVPDLVRLLGSDDIGIQASAAAALENITVCNGVVNAVEANAIPSLVKLLTSNNTAVLIATCAAFTNITSTFDYIRSKALDANAIPPLIRLLSFDDVRVQRSAMSTLKNITLYGPAKTAALSSDIIPNLVRLLTSKNINVQATAVMALESITASGGSEFAIKANAIPALVGLLFSRDVHVFIAACGALKNMITSRCATAVMQVFKSRLYKLIFPRSGNTGPWSPPLQPLDET